MNKFLLIMFISLILSGCNAKNIKSDYELSESSETGIILTSVSQDIGPGANKAYSIFYINHEDGSKFKYVNSREQTPIGYGESDFSDTNGQLYVISAPVGNYIINYWQINNGTGMRIKPNSKPAEIKFNVKKGEIVYIGNLHMNLITGENLLGINITASGYPEIIDKFGRDYDLFTKNYNHLSNVPFSKQLPFLGNWNESK